MNTITPEPALIDELGAINEKLAPLMKRRKEIEEALKPVPQGTYQGAEFSLRIWTDRSMGTERKPAE